MGRRDSGSTGRYLVGSRVSQSILGRNALWFVEFRVMVVARFPPPSAYVSAPTGRATTESAEKFADLVKNADRSDPKPARVDGSPAPRRLPAFSREKNLLVQIGQNKRNAAKFNKLLNLTKTQPESALLKILAPICKEFNERTALIEERNILTEPDHINTDKHFKHQQFFADRQTTLINNFTDQVDDALKKYPNSSFASEVRSIIYS
jgi:hypothetical protein